MERTVRYRVALLVVALCALAAGIGYRLFELQVDRSETLLAKARKQHERKTEVWGRRGAIVDRQGRELAVSIDSASLYVHPHRIENPETVARRLSPVIGVSRKKLLERLGSDEPFVWIERRLDPRTANAVRGLGLAVGPSEALNFKTEGKRYYPHGSLAAHVVGCTDVDQTGIEGAELVHDEILRGDPATYLAVRDGLGDAVLQLVTPPIRRPRDVVLTVDLVVQHIVERELAAAVRETGSNWGSAVFLDPGSGQILAMANYPGADPNRFAEAALQNRRNRAVTDTYEPGSTFKIVTAAAVLDAGTVHPEQRFNCGKGAARLDGRRIRDSSPHGVLSFREIIEVSSNVGMVHVVSTLDRKRLHDSIVSFGFSERTGIDLPGEQGGMLRAVSDWSDYSRGSLAFGHEIAVTPLQMATAFAIVANGGSMASPRIVLGMRDENGRLETAPPVRPRQVVSERTAHTLAGMLEGVVVRGTGTRAAVHGYRLAGKTGTAQKWVDGKYSETHYVASFGGFAPVSDPRLAGLVVLDEPRGDVHTGGGTAAPAFGQIMAEALAYLRVPPDDSPVLSLRMPPGAGADASGTTRPRVAGTASGEREETRLARVAGKDSAELTTGIDR